MRFKKPLFKITTLAIISSSLFLSGCLPSKIEDKIEETEKKNESRKEDSQTEPNEYTVDNIELSDEQMEILDEMKEKTVEEALFENDLELRKELSITIPEKKESYKNPDELSQYVSYLFFAFHKGKINAEKFYDEISPYLHTDFLSDLPENRLNRIETFDTIQELYISQLKSEIEKYTITDLREESRTGETVFYRKYTLKNGEEIYSITVLKKEENGSWKITDDRPAPPYITQVEQNSKK